jgi:hypothetical protein
MRKHKNSHGRTIRSKKTRPAVVLTECWQRRNIIVGVSSKKPVPFRILLHSVKTTFFIVFFEPTILCLTNEQKYYRFIFESYLILTGRTAWCRWWRGSHGNSGNHLKSLCKPHNDKIKGGSVSRDLTHPDYSQTTGLCPKFDQGFS